MISTLLTASTGLLTAGTPTVLQEFRTGTASAFIPSPNGISPTPGVAWVGDISRIYTNIITPDEAVITLKIPHNVSTTVGNIMLFLDATTPFVWLVLPYSYQKSATRSTDGNTGDHYYFNFMLDFPYLSQRISFANTQPYYATAPIYNRAENLPHPNSQPYDQVQVNNIQGRAAFGVKFNGAWWGCPFGSALNDANRFRIDGGVAGDGLLTY